MIAILLVNTVLLAANAPAPQQHDVGQYSRWAVLASAELAKTPLPDLVTVELSQRPGLTVVERQDIDAVVDELTLSQAAGTEAVGQRLQLGRLLRADAIVLLSLVDTENGKALRTVICDCRVGARLVHNLARYDAHSVSEQASGVVANAKRVVDRFPKGVRYVVGVPDFVCRDLDYKYTHLQTRLAASLSAAILACQGCTLIEIEEVQAIQRELDLIGQAVDDRLVPLFIEGEYQVEREPGDEPKLIRIKLGLRDGSGGHKTLRMEADSLEDAAAKLGKLTLGELLHGDQLPQSYLDKEAQVSLLIDRADTFSLLGDYDRSTSLREAVLLVTPSAHEQRLAAVQEYASLMTRRMDDWSGHSPPSNEEVQKWVYGLFSSWRLSLRHLKYIARSEFDDYDRGMYHFRLIYGAITHCRYYLTEPNEAVFGRWSRTDARFLLKLDDMFEEAEQGRRRFVLDDLQHLHGDPSLNEHDRYLIGTERWLAVFMPLNRSIVSSSFPENRKDLELLRGYLARVGRGRELHTPMRLWGWTMAFAYDNREESLDREYVKIISELCASQYSAYRFHGTLSKVAWSFIRESDRSQEAVGRAMAEIDATVESELTRVSKPIGRKYKRIAQSIEEALQRAAAGKHPRVITCDDETDASNKPSLDSIVRRAAGSKSLDVTRHEWRYRDFSGNETPIGRNNRTPLYKHHTYCRGGAVFWAERSVAWLTESDLLWLDWWDSNGGIQDVQWDGRYVWYAIRDNGLVVVKPGRGKVGRLKAENGDIPPCDLSLRIAPIGMGKMLAVGSFGEDCRAWMAIVEFADDRFSVDVFHEAKQVVHRSERFNESSNALHRACGYGDEPPSAAFVPMWIRRHHCSHDPDGYVFLVGRGYQNSRNSGPGPLAHPLAVDINTRTLSICPNSASIRENFLFVYQHNLDKLVYQIPKRTNESGAVEYQPPRDHVGGFPRECPIVSYEEFDLWKHKIVPFAGYVYIVTDDLIRLDPDTGQKVCIAKSVLEGMPDRYYGAAPDVGLLVWDNSFDTICLVDKSLDTNVGAFVGIHDWRVVDADTGSPLEDVTVDFETYGNTLRKKTDLSGHVQLEIKEKARHYVRCTFAKEGFGRVVLTLRSNMETADVAPGRVVKMRRLIPIGGTVVDDAGDPLAHAHVKLRMERRGSMLEDFDYMAVTDQHGRWRLYTYPSDVGLFRMHVSHERDYGVSKQYRRIRYHEVYSLRAMEHVTVLGEVKHHARASRQP